MRFRRDCALTAVAVVAFSGSSLLLLSGTDTDGDLDASVTVDLDGPLLQSSSSFRLRWIATDGGRALEDSSGGDEAVQEASLRHYVGAREEEAMEMEMVPPLVKPSTNGPFRHIFSCTSLQATSWMLFPEYDGSVTYVPGNDAVPVPTKNDLLLGAHSLINNEQCAQFIPGIEGEMLNFPGKMMFFHNECADTQGGPRLIGYDADRGDEPQDACSPGPTSCYILQGTTASQVAEFEKPGGRFNYLPPSERAFFFGSHEDSDRSIRLPLATQMWMRWGFEAFGGFDWMRDPSKKPMNTGEKFAIFLASHCIPWRDEAAMRLAQLGELHVSATWKETCADGVPNLDGPKPNIFPLGNETSTHNWMRNSAIFEEYKFALVMENSYRDGYITEKLFNAFLSGAIPIWYGGKYALEVYNPEAFVFYDVEDPQPALDRVRFLLDHPNEYEKVLRAPILKDGERTVEEYFSLTDDIGGGKLKNRIRQLIGLDQDAMNMDQREEVSSYVSLLSRENQ